MPNRRPQLLFFLFVFVCYTRNNGRAQKAELSCVPIQDCPYIYNFTKQSSNVEEVFQLLKRSHCGTDGPIHPKVWCAQVRQQNCLSPDGRDGICTPKQECHTDALAEWITLGNSKENECGEDNTHVCCPLKKDEAKKVSLPLPGDCGYHPLGRKIIGGKATELDEFAWMAILQYKDGNGSLKQACSASLINREFLVTAAHCVDPATVEHWGYERLESVVLGEYNTKTEVDCIKYDEDYQECTDRPKEIPIKSVVVHPKWNDPQWANDIAVIKLLTPVDYSDFIKPICLPLEGWTPKLNERLLITGWGKTSTETRSSIKMKAIVRNVACPHSTLSSQICAGGNGTDICNGDSGGPLMLGKYVNKHYFMFLGGIASYGFKRCGAGPSVYTYVPEYIDWIRSVIEE